MNQVYTQYEQGHWWLERYRGKLPGFVCVLGFTETGLLPGISAAGATPEARRYTAIADAEFLINGPQPAPQYPLPPLTQGASPALISRGVVKRLGIPVWLLNAGLPQPPVVPFIDLGGQSAQCLSTGAALTTSTVKRLFQQGLFWGERLATQFRGSYLMLGECVVGGTTTALAVLTGLGIASIGKVNSSHPICNHAQKWPLVQAGLARANWSIPASPAAVTNPLQLVAAVGDPMQIAVAGMAIAASRHCGVLLAGGTQMLAVYALTQSIAASLHLTWQPQQVVVGTTRWVVEDPSGDTVGLANAVGSVPLIASQLSFAPSHHPQLRAYEQGYVKEGVGAGGCAIAAHLYRGWQQPELLAVIEAIADHYCEVDSRSKPISQRGMNLCG